MMLGFLYFRRTMVRWQYNSASFIIKHYCKAPLSQTTAAYTVYRLALVIFSPTTPVTIVLSDIVDREWHVGTILNSSKKIDISARFLAGDKLNTCLVISSLTCFTRIKRKFLITKKFVQNSTISIENRFCEYCFYNLLFCKFTIQYFKFKSP